jgi:hypothetical protein
MNHSPLSAHRAGAVDPQSETDTRLAGSGLGPARLLSLTLYALSVGFFVAGVLAYIANHYTFCTGPAAGCLRYGTVVAPPTAGPGLSSDFVGIYIVVRDSLFALGYWVVAAFLFWRRSDDRVALLAATGLGTFPLVFNPGFVSTLSAPWSFPALVVSFLVLQCHLWKD